MDNHDRPTQADHSDSSLACALGEHLAALEAGNAPPDGEFLARYPELADDLKACLAGLKFLRKAAPNAGEDREERETLENLGDFRLIRELGRGGMGAVYEAEQVSLSRRVALKVLPFAATLDPRQLQRFHNEARAVACLHHPHIVPVHAVGCEHGVHFFAMQLIDGQTLADLISQRGASGSQTQDHSTEAIAATGAAPSSLSILPSQDRAYFLTAGRLGIEAAEALEHAHALGIVHRDIKPGNLMVDGQGKLWVTDFGLARLGADAGLTGTGDLLGTLRYMSPEQVQARPGVVDHRSDIYSLGATLYELLTLRPPVPGNDRGEMLRQIAQEEPCSPRQLNRAIPAELETVVLKALAKEPAERYASAQELADDLRRWLEDLPIRARPPAVLGRAWRWCRRRPARASLIALILLVGLGLLPWLWLVHIQLAQAQERLTDRAAEAQGEVRRSATSSLAPFAISGDPPRDGHGLKAELFIGADFDRKAGERYDREINLLIDADRSMPGLPGTLHSVRWTGWLKAPAHGRYVLSLTGDNSPRLWLDGKLLEHRMHDPSSTLEVELTGGPQALRVDYCNYLMPGFCCVRWRPVGSSTLEIIPPEALFHDRAAAVRTPVPARPASLLQAGGASDGFARRVALDAEGNIYVMGGFRGPANFGPGPGKVELTATGTTSLFVARYSTKGQLDWARRLGGAGEVTPEGLAVSQAGIVHVTGSFRGTLDFDPGATGGVRRRVLSCPGDCEQVFVCKLARDGNLVWIRHAGSERAGGGATRGWAVTADARGDVYVTGSFADKVDFDPGPGRCLLEPRGEDLFVWKLSEAGQHVWAHRAGGRGRAEGKAVKVDGDGNLLVCGSANCELSSSLDGEQLPKTGVSGAYFAMLVLKLTPGGKLLWARSAAGADSALHATNLAVGHDGSALIGGEMKGTLELDTTSGRTRLACAGEWDIFVCKLDRDGRIVWAKRFGDTAPDEARDIALDEAGNIYLPCRFCPPELYGSPGYRRKNSLLRLSPDGRFLGQHRLTGRGGAACEGTAVDAAGNAYVVGSFIDTIDFDPVPSVRRLTNKGELDFFLWQLSAPRPPK